MNLKAKEGKNQKGLCFVSDEESDFERGVYEIQFRGKTILADVRKSPHIPKGITILDSRLFSYLDCDDASELTFIKSSSDIPICKELRLSVSSMRKLDNKSIVVAISKRINDLQDDFEGLILQENQRIIVDRLGIQFTVHSISPINGSCESCRIIWNQLEKVHLAPIVGIPTYNLICVIELAAAAHISDINQSSTNEKSMSVSRYHAALEVLDQIISNYSGYGTDSQFSGFIYSDEVETFSVFNPETGAPVEISSLYSKSLLESFRDWICSRIPAHKNKPSNPGQALSIALNRGNDFSETNEHPTVIFLFSSGVHSHGPNPVKEVKKSLENRAIPVFCVSLGAGSNKDILGEIATITKGALISINSMSDIAKINDIIEQHFENRS
ncbi:MAG: VWA domain-containing protein [Candidatus Thorarchaeota archaeon]|nr:VWA domain-containing protein [Candidatus Thorarchaeota archaeon]